MAYLVTGEELVDFVNPQAHKKSKNDRTYISFSPTAQSSMSFQTEKLADDVTIVQGMYEMGDDLVISGSGDQDLLEIQVNLSPQDIHFLDDKKQQKSTPARTANISFLAAENNKMDLIMEKDRQYQTFDIHLPLYLLERYAGESVHLDRLLHNIRIQETTMFSDRALTLSPQIIHTIEQMQQCNFQGVTRQLYLDSKVYELLALLHQQLSEPHQRAVLHPKDIERVKEAAALINIHIDNPQTIPTLAKVVGMSPTKLKKDFKEIFGVTIFDYLQQLRMKKAKSYLLESSLSIQEISFKVGYNSSSNFSIAFKAFFGYPPSQLRKSGF